MKTLIKALFVLFLRQPKTTDAIVSAMTKTVTKLESHADKTEAKVTKTETQVAAMIDTAAKLAEDVAKARAVAKNIGALLK